MWARISELILGLWLFASYFVFADYPRVGFFAATLMCIFALFSYINFLNKMHLLQVIPAALLIYEGFSYPTPFLPFGLQNFVVVALLLLMFTIVPSNASDHPRPWKKFLEK